MAGKILIVDDSEVNCAFLQEILKGQYELILSGDGTEALKQLEELGEKIDIMLLDLHMPNMDGFALMAEMKKRNMMDRIPILVITGEDDCNVEERCFEYGVSDFLLKPFEPAIIRQRVKNIIELFGYRKSLEKKIEQQTATLHKQNRLLLRQAAQLHETNIRIIDILGTVIEYRNLESGEHIKHVKGYTKILAKQVKKLYPEYGLNKTKIEQITASSSLHDIGKIAIPDHILLKPGRLTDEEFECMKTHTTKGCEILDSIDNVWDQEQWRCGYEICRHHHERYDGNGYPDGLKGDDIPISAQIVSIADVYDALVSDRSYKKAVQKDIAYDMIMNGKCGVFSPKLLHCLEAARKDFEKLTVGNQA